MVALSFNQPGYCTDGKCKGIFVQVCFWNRSVAHIFWEDDIRPPFPSGDFGENVSHEYDFSHPLCLGPSQRDYLHGPAYDRPLPEKPRHRISFLMESLYTPVVNLCGRDCSVGRRISFIKKQRNIKRQH